MEQLNNNNGEQINFLPHFRVFCPLCSWRLMDKLTPLEGTVQIKCPNCRKVVEVNLRLRLNRSRTYYGVRTI